MARYALSIPGTFRWFTWEAIQMEFKLQSFHFNIPYDHLLLPCMAPKSGLPCENCSSRSQFLKCILPGRTPHHFTSSRLFCQRPQGDSSKISDSSSLSSSSSGEAAEVVEVTGGDTDVRPGAEDKDSTFESEPLLSTVWASRFDMLEWTLRPYSKRDALAACLHTPSPILSQ